ncbi:Transcription factor GRAS protein [Raphanus sativus]|nr:Transcription factor GRAS protein [Raphanus sativus]
MKIFSKTRRFRSLLIPPLRASSHVGVIGNVTDPSRFETRPSEAVVVHWMQHRLYDVTGSYLDAVEIIRRWKPSLVTVMEQELSCDDDGGGCCGVVRRAWSGFQNHGDDDGGGGMVLKT